VAVKANWLHRKGLNGHPRKFLAKNYVEKPDHQKVDGLKHTKIGKMGGLPALVQI